MVHLNVEVYLYVHVCGRVIHLQIVACLRDIKTNTMTFQSRTQVCHIFQITHMC